MTFHRPSGVNLISYILFSISAAILVGVVAFTMNVQVLRDWSLVLPDGPIHAGDTITIQSIYTKLRTVTGTSSRYLDCKNSPGSYIRYPINQANADRAPGVKTGTGVVMKLPETIPNLPATCRISIVIKYPVYPWRTVTEFNSTKDFQLLSSLTAPPASVSSIATQTSQGQFVSRDLADTSSSLNPMPADTTAQQDTSQPQLQPQPTLIQSLLNTLTTTTSGLLSVLK